MENEIYVSPTTAQLLKDAGFDWPCKMFYTHDSSLDGEWHLFPNTRPQNRNREYDSGVVTISAPTLDVAHRWVRQECGWMVVVELMPSCLWRATAVRIGTSILSKHYGFSTYDDALEAGLDYILRRIMNSETTEKL